MGRPDKEFVCVQQVTYTREVVVRAPTKIEAGRRLVAFMERDLAGLYEHEVHEYVRSSANENGTIQFDEGRITQVRIEGTYYAGSGYGLRDTWGDGGTGVSLVLPTAQNIAGHALERERWDEAIGRTAVSDPPPMRAAATYYFCGDCGEEHIHGLHDDEEEVMAEG